MQWARNYFKEKSWHWYQKDKRPWKDTNLDYLLSNSPRFIDENYDLYTLRVRYLEASTGLNHNTDHQLYRQGVWVWILNHLGLVNKKSLKALTEHFTNDGLARGYLIKERVPSNYNFDNISGDQLIGMLFGWLDTHQQFLNFCVSTIANEVRYFGCMYYKDKPSKFANFRPGIQNSATPVPIGIQHLVYCAIMLSGQKSMSDFCETAGKPTDDLGFLKSFRVRFYLYFGWLSILFPTASVWFKRGYNNDCIAMMSNYICWRLSTNRFEKWVFARSARNVFSLSTPWLNGFFAGLVKEMTYGKYPSDEYMHKCQNYAVECANSLAVELTSEEPAKQWPIDPDKRNCGEFLCDEDQEKQGLGTKRYQSTLGQLLQLIWSYKWELKYENPVSKYLW